MQWVHARPDDVHDRPHRRRRNAVWVAVAVFGLLLVGSAAVAVGHIQASATDVQPVLSFEDLSDTGGQSVLTRTDGMVVLALEAADLRPGDAYTVWWVVFNAPENCSGGECGEDDIFSPDGALDVAGVQAAQIGVGNATGNIAKTNGTAEFGARLKRNDVTTDHQVLFPAGLAGPGVLTASGLDAEVHLIVQHHGQARGGTQLSNQLSLVEYGCTPGCADVQFAVHK